MDTMGPSTPSEPGLELASLAEELQLEWTGDGELLIQNVASLENAGEHDLAFVRSAQWVSQFEKSRAGAVIVPRDFDSGPRNVLRSSNPALDFSRAVRHLRPALRPQPGIHPAAWIAEDADVDASASVAPGVVIGAGCRVGPLSILHPNVILYPDVEIGSHCEVHAGSVLREGTRLGNRILLQPGVVLGGNGFGYVPDAEGTLHSFPQLGRVVIEDEVEIGAGSTVDRATLDETRIRRGAKIDNLVQIAHNCDIGEDVIIAAQTGLSGGTIVDRGAIVMAQVGSAGHLRIGRRAFVGARAGLHKDIPDGGRVWGTPQMEEKRWHRSMAALRWLPDLMRRLRVVEKTLGLRAKAQPESIELGERVDARGRRDDER